MLDRTLAPVAHSIQNVELIHPKKTVLPSGVHLFYFSGGDQEVVRMEFLFRNSTWDQGNPALLTAANALLLEGTKKRSAAAIAEAFDYYGAFVSTEHGQDYGSLTLHCLTKHLSKVLPILVEVLNEADFPEKELKTWKQNQGQRLQVSLEKNDVVARRQFNKSIWGANHPYGYGNEISDYEKVTVPQLQGLHRRMYHADNCKIYIAGKLSAQDIIAIEGCLHGLHTGKTEQHPLHETTAFVPGRKQVKGPKSLQAAIRIGKPFITKTHPDFAALQVLNTVLGGYFGSRLMANIREDKGYTYGIGSGIASMREGGFFYIGSEVGAEVAEATIQEIYKEIRLLQEELISEEELNRVRNYMLGTYVSGIENIFSHADKYKGIHLFNLGYEYYENYLKTIKTVSAERLQGLAKQYLATDSFCEVVVA